LARLNEKPDLTLHALLTELGARGVTVCCDTLWRFLHREGLSFKKSVAASEQERPDVARRRAAWKRFQARIVPERLVFIDETWTKTSMFPLRGWCRRGGRLHAKVPHGHWKTMTFVAALRCEGIDAPCVFDGPINGASFKAYVEQVLAPALRPGDVVVMDNRRRNRHGQSSDRSEAYQDALCLHRRARRAKTPFECGSRVASRSRMIVGRLS
jgi:hypothetical protein